MAGTKNEMVGSGRSGVASSGILQKRPLLQLVDILLGAVAYGKNDHHKQPSAFAYKLELGRHVMRRAGIRDLTVNTSKTGKFTVWHRLLQT